MASQPEDAFSQVWEQIWDFQEYEGQSLDELEIKKKIYLKSSTPFVAMFGIVGTFIFFINLPVVISCVLILKKRQGMKSTYWLLGNISLSDTIVGLVKLSSLMFPHSEVSSLRCDIYIAVCTVCGMSSINSVALIAIDRYLYIVHGLKYNQWVKPMRLKIIMLISWSHAIFIGILPFLLWNSDARTGGKLCLLLTTVNPTFLVILGFSAIVPMTVACIFQGIILYNAIKNVIKLKTGATGVLRMFRGHSQSMNSNEKRKFSESENCHEKSKQINNPSKLKAIKVVLFTTGSMMITIMPCLVCCVLFATCDPILDEEKCRRLKYLAGMPLYLLMLSNCFMNPIIYAWWHKGFRDTLKKIYLSKVKQHKVIKQLENSIIDRQKRSGSVQTLQSQMSTSSSVVTMTHL